MGSGVIAALLNTKNLIWMSYTSDQQYVAEERAVRFSYSRIENSPHALRLQGLLEVEGHCSSVAGLFSTYHSWSPVYGLGTRGVGFQIEIGHLRRLVGLMSAFGSLLHP